MAGSIDYVIQEGEKALKETPEQLPVLKEAGVVDAGGAGFLVIMVGLKAVLDGNVIDHILVFKHCLSPRFR